MEGFTYIPVLSREQWEGRSGYVHPVYEELCSRQAGGTLLYMRLEGHDRRRPKKRILEMGYDKKISIWRSTDNPHDI